MWKTYILEIINLFAAAGILTSNSITDQYLYQVISEKHNYTANSSIEYCSENSNDTSNEKYIVAEEVSNWKIYMSLSSGIPAMITSVFLTTWSDKIGRKIPLAISLVGYAASNLLQVFVITYGWPPFTLVIRTAIWGIAGSYSAVLNISMAFLSDVSTKSQKVKRYALLECTSGIGGGLASLGSGFWITSHGFLPSACFVCTCSFISVVLVWFLPLTSRLDKNEARAKSDIMFENESDMLVTEGEDGYGSINCEKSIHEERETLLEKENTKQPSRAISLFKNVWKIYTTNTSTCDLCDIGTRASQTSLCSHGGGHREGRVWRIWCYLLSFNVFLYTLIGSNTITAMYFLAYPMCFTPTNIGLYVGISYCSSIAAPFIVALCKSTLKWGNCSILILSIFMTIVAYTMTGLARQPYVAFISAAILLFRIIPLPVIRAQISSLASEFEQGASLSLVSGTASFITALAQVTYSLIYPSTLDLVQGFIWFLLAITLILPFFLMIIVGVADKRKLAHSNKIEGRF